jgi:N-acylglucosamine-6-phosphate 2-epimerase
VSALARLRGGLIVSVQAEAGSVLNTPETIALLARCAVQNGAAGVRIEGLERIRAVRAAVDVPIVGLVKRTHGDFPVYITPALDDVAAIAAAGAEIVAFDATGRAREGSAGIAELAAAAHRANALALADCATASDGRSATASGADALATTLAGYTDATRGRELPAFDLLAELAALAPFALCEGGVAAPAMVRAAFASGASAVVVGTAITNIDWLVRAFAQAARGDESASFT